MTAHRSTASQTPVSTAGLLHSLSAALPNPSCPLARSAGRLADRLAHGGTRADRLAAADLLARLLDATDTDCRFDEDGLLDESFDA